MIKIQIHLTHRTQNKVQLFGLKMNNEEKQHLLKLSKELMNVQRVLDEDTIEIVHGTLECISKTLMIISERIK